MGQASKIEWTDATFNPWIGCEKVAPECDHCYAETRARRVGESELWNGERRRTTVAYWRGPLKWARTLPAELGRRPRVFCASLADVFDNKVPPEWRADLFALIRATPELDWLLLTKRIGNALPMVNELLVEMGNDPPGYVHRAPFWPWPNVWLGITAGTQAAFDRDVPKLLATPAAVRFVSIEPLLGPVDLRVPVPGCKPRDALRSDGCSTHAAGHCLGDCPGRWPALDWVIAGGESGPGARPMHPDWPRAIRDQCAAASTAFLFKQWGEWAPGENVEGPAIRTEHTASLVDGVWDFGKLTPAQSAELHRDDEPDLFRVGKKAAGRELDGRLHDEFPRVLELAPPAATVTTS